MLRTNFNMFKMAAKSTSTRRWSDNATMDLIDLWGEESIQLALDSSKSSKQTRAIYQSLMVKMCEKGYTDFTVDHIISKMKKLKHKHKTECDKKRRSGRNREKPWKFFESLDRILGTRANVQPPFLLDSSSVSIDEQLFESDNDVEDETDKSTIEPAEVNDYKVLEDEEAGIDDIEIDSKETLSKSELPNKSKQPKEKQRKKSNFEKGIEIICDKFSSANKSEMEWYMKMEEDRHKRDVEFQLKQAQLENERRQQDREHELRLFRLLAGQSGSTFQPQQTFQPPALRPAVSAGFSNIMMGSAPYPVNEIFTHSYDYHNEESLDPAMNAKQFTKL